MKEDKFTNEVLESIGELNPKRQGVAPTQFKLGEEMANGILYWGQEKTVKTHRTAMCICPACGNSWRVRVANVMNGRSKACCGQGTYDRS